MHRLTDEDVQVNSFPNPSRTLPAHHNAQPKEVETALRLTYWIER